MAKISLLGLLLAVVMSAGASLLVVRLIRPVTQLAGLMERISRDDLAENIPYATYGNEVGSIARAVVILKDSAVTRIALERNKGVEAAERAARQERIEALIDEFRATTKTALGAVNKTVDDLLATAGSLGAGALRTVQDAGAASNASRDATGNVQDRRARRPRNSRRRSARYPLRSSARALSWPTRRVARATPTPRSTVLPRGLPKLARWSR